MEGLAELDSYEEKVKAGHTFTLEEVERVQKLTERVRKATSRANNRATKKKRKKRK